LLDSVIFYFFGGIAVLSAALMITRRNALHSAVFLLTTLLATAGIFLQLRAEFIFIAQLILFAGGIVLLFVFVILLVRLDVPLPRIRFRLRHWVAVFVALVVFLEGGIILLLARSVPGHGLLVLNPAPADKLPANTEELAKSLFGMYLLPFEIASILLLVAMIGAVIMGKKRTAAP
jgi:NADH-quinone oxidoreductase subunit J